jgi:hypothetical protein
MRLWLKEAYLKFAYSRKGACEHFSIARSLAEIAQEQEHRKIMGRQTAGLAE